MNKIVDIKELDTPLSPAKSSPESSEQNRKKSKFKLKALTMKTEPENFLSN